MLGTIRAWFVGKKNAAPEVLELSAAASPVVEAGAPTSEVPIDFVAVLAAAGIQPEVRHRVVKAKHLLRSLPSDAPSATKRQIVEAAFQVFEIPTQKIIDGASAEIEALRAYIQIGEEAKAAKLVDGEHRIADLEGEIRDARALMDLAIAAQERRQRLTTEEIATVQPIVQFFAHEVIPAALANGDVAGAGQPSAAIEVDIVLADAAASGPRAKSRRGVGSTLG